MTNTVKPDTGAAKLPALPSLKGASPELQAWAKAVNERLQVREGERGNELDRAVTLRELQEATAGLQGLSNALNRKPGDGEILLEISPGLTASVAVDRFAQSIIDSRLFQDLAKSLFDPTRFDYLPEEIREVLKTDLMAEAKKRKAAIEDTQKVIDTYERSMAMAVRQITASLKQAHAAVQQTQVAWSDGNQAIAGQFTQLEAQLEGYYESGEAGRVKLEEAMQVLASYSEGLRAQYTMKLQAGGAVAGFGLAAEDVNGKITSAFIINANQFAIVAPNYNGGVLAVPRPEDVVFGVDTDGIYMQRTVYLKGNMRIDGTSRVLSDGLRGSLQIAATGAAWSDTTARQAIWLALGNTGSAPNNNHLVIGDMVTISLNGGGATTKHWVGGAWSVPGVVINGSLLVDGSVAARHINTNGLTIRDNEGRIILSSGGVDASWVKNLMVDQVGGLGSLATKNGLTAAEIEGLGKLATLNGITTDDVSGLGRLAFLNGLTAEQINGLGGLAFLDRLSTTEIDGLGSIAFKDRIEAGEVFGLGALAVKNGLVASEIGGLGSLATKNGVTTDEVSGLGRLAKENGVFVGSNVLLPDGNVMNIGDFVNRLSKINVWNIGTFMDSAAIGSAYIGNLAVQNAHIQNAAIDSFKIAGGSVTSMAYMEWNGADMVQWGGQSTSLGIYTKDGSTGTVISASISASCAAASSGAGEVVVYLTLYRDDVAIATATTEVICIQGVVNGPNPVYYYKNSYLFYQFNVFDKPAEGWHYYKVGLQMRGYSGETVKKPRVVITGLGAHR